MAVRRCARQLPPVDRGAAIARARAHPRPDHPRHHANPRESAVASVVRERIRGVYGAPARDRRAGARVTYGLRRFFPGTTRAILAGASGATARVVPLVEWRPDRRVP